MLSPLSILNRYNSSNKDTQELQTEEARSSQEHSLEASGSQIRTPSQQLADALLGRFNVKKLAPLFSGILSKFGFSVDIIGALQDIEDPVKWHNSLSAIHSVVGRVLREDIEGGYIPGETAQPDPEPDSTGPTDTSEIIEEGRVSSSSESLSGGDDGQREVNTDASVDDELPEPVQLEEASGQDVDSGHEATFQSANGTEWSINDDNW